jgi:uncharacterized membrane protein YdjX (TVP38/TMEM64 family)
MIATLTKLPHSLEQVKELRMQLSLLPQTTVLTYWMISFILLQSFAIPGSVLLSVLAGALFGLAKGIVLVCLASTFGSTICYFLSKTFAQSLVARYPQRLEQVKRLLKESNGMLPGFLFMRITPILPNWLVTIASPHVGINLPIFVVGTFLGVMPVSYLHVSAGEALDNLSSNDISIFTPRKLLGIFAVGLLPFAVQRIFAKSTNSN